MKLGEPAVSVGEKVLMYKKDGIIPDHTVHIVQMSKPHPLFTKNDLHLHG